MLVLRRNFCVLLSFLLGICVLTQGTDIYVYPGAVGGDGSPALPYGSIQQAIGHAVSGDSIILYNGTYSGTANNMLTLGSLTSLTIRGFDNDPALTVITWTEPSLQPFLNTNVTAISLTIQGISFRNRPVADDPNTGFCTPTIKISGGSSLLMDNCRFENFYSQNPQSILYIHITTLSSVTVRNTYFLNGVGQWGIELDTGNLTIDKSTFVGHPGYTTNFGSCVYLRAVAGPSYLTISSSNFVSNISPLRFTKGNVTLSSNTFYNSTTSILCSGTISTTIIASGNKFCGGSTTNCSQVPIGSVPARPFDACGICDGNNANKDCNGVCYGSARGALCQPAKTWWVSPYGTGDGSSRNAPLGNISSAVSAANPRDTVLLLAGNYTGAANLNINTQGKQAITITSEYGNPDLDNVTITCDTTNSNAFTFASRESFDTVVQGINIENCGSGSVSPVFVGTDTGVTIKSVNIRNGGSQQNVGQAVQIDNGFLKLNDVTIQNIASLSGVIYASGARKTTYLSAVGLKFLNNYVYDSSGIYLEYGNVEISNSYFVNNDAYNKGATFVIAMSTLQLNGNSFYNTGMTALANPRSMHCASLWAGYASSNSFCGATTTLSNNCAMLSGSAISPNVDACGVCNGNNSTMDCSGNCFGRNHSCLP